jgi:hypothetical protein
MTSMQEWADNITGDNNGTTTGQQGPGSYTIGNTTHLPGFGPQYDNPGAQAPKNTQFDPWAFTGIGGVGYQNPGRMGNKLGATNNPIAQQFFRAAQGVNQAAMGADAAMLQAYRDIYRARLGGAAAGQQQFIQQQGAEAAGMGLSPDLVRRMVANRQAQQAQMLGAQEGELAGMYQNARAPLIQQTGNTLASMMIDQLKFQVGRMDAKDAANQASKQQGIANGLAVAGLVAAPFTGGLSLGLMGAGGMGGGGGASAAQQGYGPTSGYNGYQGMLPPGSY